MPKSTEIISRTFKSYVVDVSAKNYEAMTVASSDPEVVRTMYALMNDIPKETVTAVRREVSEKRYMLVSDFLKYSQVMEDKANG